ncbi:MAG: right-handed parallel beta-helix repeat-containing protein [Bryobacterales bacterium]|nr:right-handed parallel beta-helix repeat-containing protein [Bryobacterales bacterium]
MLRVILGIGAILLTGCQGDGKLRQALAAKSGEVQLSGGEVTLSAPLVIEGADNLTVIGMGAVLKVDFEGEAAIVVRNSKNIRIENVSVLGSREKKEYVHGLPPSDVPMIKFTRGNGIVIDNSDNVTIAKSTIRLVQGYGVLASNSRKVALEELLIGDSGSLNDKGKNNATGGILFEEGCRDFTVRRSKIRNVRGNGIWTHSLYTSPRNEHGEFAANDIRYVARDALQAGHAVDVRVTDNTGGFIGFPSDQVDVATFAVPVALDTAGNVEKSVYSGNKFEEVNGKCLDLDGFHHGAVEKNECRNARGDEAYPYLHFAIVLNNSNPDMESRDIRIAGNRMQGFRYGAVFLIGEGHLVKDNVFARINLANCGDAPKGVCTYKPEEPDMLRSGVYFGLGAHRPSPARKNVVEGNTVHGFGMSRRCVGHAPGVKPADNIFRGNACAE